MGPVLTHIAMHVQDLDASVVFYREYCSLEVVHDRGEDKDRVVWLAEPGRARDLVIVLIPGGSGQPRSPSDYSHFGFAMASVEAVDDIAAKAQAEGRLLWPPRQESYPVGYFCGVRDPDGQPIEFSFGQPLGPGPRRHTQPSPPADD